MAAISERRAGTAVKVVRIRPLPYSPVIDTAPIAATASTSTRAPFPVKASMSGEPLAMKDSRPRSSYWYQYL